MESLARTVVRFAGALLVGGVAAVYDTRAAIAPQIEVLSSSVQATQGPAPIAIQPGKRAVSVRVLRTAVFEFGVRPNTRVDVITSAQGPSAKRSSTAETVLSDVRVLAVGPLPQRSSETGAAAQIVVTLEVTVEQAQTIALAQAKGTLGLALHGSDVRR